MTFQTITALPIYASYSLEELRCQDLGISTPLAVKNAAAAPVTFGAPATTSFGATTSTFGTQSTGFGQQPANTGFGAFGAQNQQQKPNSGFSFGGAATAPTSTFGSSFGQQPAATSGFGGFGSTSTTTPAFGTTAPSTTGFGSTGFGATGFGAQSQSSQNKPFSFGGTTTATAPISGFGGFGATSSSTSGFNAPASTTGFGGFGSTAPTTTSGFSGFGAQPGATAPATTSGFGGFGSQPGAIAPSSTGFGGFGAASTSGFGQTTSTFGTPSTNTFQFGANSGTGSSFGGFGSTTVKPSTGFGALSTGFGAPATSNQFNFNKPATGAAPLQFGAMPATAGQMSLPPGAVVVTLGSASITDQDPFRFPDISKLYSSSNPTTATTSAPTSSPSYRGPSSPNIWKTAVPPKIHVQSKPRHYHLANVAANRSGNVSISSLSTRIKPTSNSETPLQALGEAELLETDRFLAAIKSSRTLNSMEIPKEIEISPTISNDPPICNANNGLTLIPSIEELQGLSQSSLSNVDDFRVTHEFGELLWPGKTDLNGVNFDTAISFEPRTVEVYPENYYTADTNDRKLIAKPSTGTKLNKTCQVTLHNCWPLNKDKQRVRTTDDASLEKYKQLLIQSCLKQHIKFIDYNSSIGDWKFEVEHF